jgi:hypothetical protein
LSVSPIGVTLDDASSAPISERCRQSANCDNRWTLSVIGMIGGSGDAIQLSARMPRGEDDPTAASQPLYKERLQRATAFSKR